MSNNRTTNTRRTHVAAAGSLARIAALATLGLTAVAFYIGVANWLFTRNLVSITPGMSILVIMALGTVAAIAAMLSGHKLQIGLIIVSLTYVLIVLVSGAVRAQEEQLVIARLSFMVGLPLLALCASMCTDRERHFIITTSLLVSCAVIVVDYFLSEILPAPMTDVVGRAAGFQMNPNNAANLIALLIPLSALRTPTRYRPLLYAVTLFAIFITFSRGGIAIWLAAIILTEGFLLRTSAMPAKLLLLSFLAAILLSVIMLLGDQIAAGAVYLFGANLTPDAISRLNRDVDDFASQERLYAALYGWNMFVDHPLFGSGLGGGIQWQFPVRSHNMIIQTLVEFGLLGFIWLTGFLAVIWRAGKKLGVVLVFLWMISAMFNHNLFDYYGFAFVIALYICSRDSVSFLRGVPRRRLVRLT